MKDLLQLKTEINMTEDKREKLSLLENAVAVADQNKLEQEAYELRMELIDIATDIGQPLKAMVSFSINLKYADQNPDNIDTAELLWIYKWILSIAPRFHQVTKQQLDDMLSDFRKRLLSYGDSITAYYTKALAMAITMGDEDKVHKFYKLRNRSPRGELDNCSICLLDDDVYYKTLTKGLEAGEKEAKKIFDKNLSCSSVPEVTYTTLMLAAIDLGEHDKIDAYRKKAYKLNKDDQSSLGVHGYQIIAYLACKNPNEALTLFKKVFPSTSNSSNSGKRFFEFYQGAYMLFESLLTNGTEEVVLPFAIEDICEKNEPCSITPIKEYFQHKAEELATLFDQRNENEAYSKKLKHYRTVLGFA